jgi:hypothetical protein
MSALKFLYVTAVSLALSTPLMADEYKKTGEFAALTASSVSQTRGIEFGSYAFSGYYSSVSFLHSPHPPLGASENQFRLYLGIGVGKAPFEFTLGPNIVIDHGVQLGYRVVLIYTIQHALIGVSGQKSYGYGHDISVIAGYAF